MTSMLKIMPQRLGFLVNITRSFTQAANEVNKNLIYNPLKRINLRPFLRIQSKILEDPARSADNLISKLSESGANPNNFKDDLKDLSIIVQTDEHIQKIINEVKKLSESDEITKRYIMDNLVRSLINLNKIDEIVQLFKESDSLRSNLSFYSTASILFNCGKYDEVYTLFEAYMPRYSAADYIKVNQKIPFTHLELVSTCLLLINSKESFIKAKKLVKTAKSLNSQLPITTKASIIYLAIKQDDIEFANKCLENFQLEKDNPYLQKSFKILIQVKSNMLNEAMKNLSILIKPTELSMEERKILRGRCFPTVLNALHDAVKATNNDDLINQMDKKADYINKSQRLMSIDLEELLINNQSNKLMFYRHNERDGEMNQNNRNRYMANNNRSRSMNTFNRNQNYERSNSENTRKVDTNRNIFRDSAKQNKNKKQQQLEEEL